MLAARVHHTDSLTAFTHSTTFPNFSSSSHSLISSCGLLFCGAFSLLRCIVFIHGAPRHSLRVRQEAILTHHSVKSFLAHEVSQSPMKQPYKTNWRVYLPGLFMVSIVASVMYFNRTKADAVKFGHDFVPIYSEDGKLEGFTHPVLVNAGNQYREKQDGK